MRVDRSGQGGASLEVVYLGASIHGKNSIGPGSYITP
jgi:hypothetical protein